MLKCSLYLRRVKYKGKDCLRLMLIFMRMFVFFMVSYAFRNKEKYILLCRVIILSIRMNRIVEWISFIIRVFKDDK